ncbi:MAG: hypothetical protein JWN04_1565, partial [Myxococcaceae bacterium]|nr:hypothetical protein [Myxococcaceae bacterium]
LTLLALSIVGLRLRRNRERALALGLAAIAAQNLVDFSLELVGVASVAAIAAGTLLSKERGRLGLARPSLRPVSVALSLAACLASIAAIPFLTTDGRQSVRIHLEGALDNPSGEFERTLKRAFKAYSVDPTLIALGAARAVRRGSANAPRWLNLAMEAAPGWAAPHQYAAYLLERRGALSQAALELSLSFEKDLALTTGPACGFVRRHPVAALSEQLVPESAKRLDVSQLVAQCLVGAGAPAEAELFLTWLMSQHPRSLLAHELAIELALNAGHLEEAVQRAKIMSALFPGNPASVGAALRALSRAGKVAEALQFYDHAPPKAQTDRRVLMEVMEAAAAAGDQGRLEAFSEETFARYGGTTAARAELHAYASHTFELAGNLGKALGLAQRSYEESSSPAMLENVHSLAQRAGIRQVALRAATELCHLRQRGETYCAGEPR